MLEKLTEECKQAVEAEKSPVYTYKVFEIEEITEDSVKLGGCTLVLRGRDIAAHLKGCDKAVLLGATIGAGIDKLIRASQPEDMARAVIIDRLAGLAVERLCNEAAALLEEKYPDYSITKRYSPGYGDFPLSAQRGFSDVLRLPETIGVHVSGSMTLTPSKSVTAVLGLAGH